MGPSRDSCAGMAGGASARMAPRGLPGPAAQRTDDDGGWGTGTGETPPGTVAQRRSPHLFSDLRGLRGDRPGESSYTGLWWLLMVKLPQPLLPPSLLSGKQVRSEVGVNRALFEIKSL